MSFRLQIVERGTGLEPATICLEGRDSTTELPPLKPNDRLPGKPGLAPNTALRLLQAGAWDRD